MSHASTQGSVGLKCSSKEQRLAASDPRTSQRLNQTRCTAGEYLTQLCPGLTDTFA
jgi:hypothetical protein